VILECLD
jgi:hypothetical protein